MTFQVPSFETVGESIDTIIPISIIGYIIVLSLGGFS